ncbi:unnamed protein product [Dracunculus medinensis]|uniref:protein acetyllysine N-acetyltransferase n=1 Tax=Dracunculus medinensis TaxID=318479 RepID=A0A0N4U3F0_DRAME|nr:unnamed protein product [Dracunculus medinensis]
MESSDGSAAIDRRREIEEDDEIINQKCEQLAELMKNSKCTMVYTGAGISTAASIPDYRGPNGVWTLAEKGITLTNRCGDPVLSCPTTSHMILKEMCRHGIVQHIVSQNCDGLHLRSGVPQKMLSEIHGNMHIEVCARCDPPRQFIRPFDVTQNSQFRNHGTGRVCDVCYSELVDTIVHFGESGNLPWPLNWKGALSLLDKCDLILCIGSSLAVLKHYQFLWPKPRSTTQASLFFVNILKKLGVVHCCSFIIAILVAIVNLQWTPKDRIACLKINAKSDRVLEKIAVLLEIPITKYCRNCDLLLHPRRNVRINELRDKITDCACHKHSRARSSTEQISNSNGTPGWWSVGIKTIKNSFHTRLRKKHKSSNQKNYETESEDENRHLNTWLPEKPGTEKHRSVSTAYIIQSDRIALWHNTEEIRGFKKKANDDNVYPFEKNNNFHVELTKIQQGSVRTGSDEIFISETSLFLNNTTRIEWDTNNNSLMDGDIHDVVEFYQNTLNFRQQQVEKVKMRFVS